jgi:hypothetical protein
MSQNDEPVNRIGWVLLPAKGYVEVKALPINCGHLDSYSQLGLGFY